MLNDGKTLIKNIGDMIVGKKYGFENESSKKYIYKKDNNIVIDYYLREYSYDHRHTEQIHYEFEVDKKDETLLRLNYLKMDSDDLYGNLPLSTLEYKKKDKDDTEYLFKCHFENNQFNIKLKDAEIKNEHIKKCIYQTLKFVDKIDLDIIYNNPNKRRRVE
jgi:hypothetical protein